MANKKHLNIIKQGVEKWNRWRWQNDIHQPNLEEADLSGMNLEGINLEMAKLAFANLEGTHLEKANLEDADFQYAHFKNATLDNAMLQWAWLMHADLHSASLSGAYINGADLSYADLTGADLTSTILIKSKVEGAIFSECHIYGSSVWDLIGQPANQSNLIITASDQPRLTTDNLEIAQFIYLLLNRQKLRNVIDSITSKAVLILGRFTPERKAVLDAMANELRRYNLLPMIFDFERATSRDFTETIKILAGLSLFVIVDITNPKSTPLELQATIPDYQIPFVPIIQEGEVPFSMFSDLTGKYDWVLQPVQYSSIENLLLAFKGAIIDRAWEKRIVLQNKKTEKTVLLSVDQFLAEAP